jgi:hypothetical protein
MPEINLENLKLPLKTVVMIVIYIGSLLSVYFVMQNKVTTALDKVTTLETRMNKYDLETMDYKIDEMGKTITGISAKIDGIYTLVLEKSRK